LPNELNLLFFDLNFVWIVASLVFIVIWYIGFLINIITHNFYYLHT